MKKICVLGANGMAGHVIFTYFTEKGYDTYGIAKGAKETEKTRDIDVLDKITFEKWLDDNKFDDIMDMLLLYKLLKNERNDFNHMLEKNTKADKQTLGQAIQLFIEYGRKVY